MMAPTQSYFIRFGLELLVCCLAHWGSTGVFLLLRVALAIQRPGIAIVGQLTESMSPRFVFIMVVIMTYLFVLGDSLTS